MARAGLATVFPQAIGLAATWDTALMHRVADTISTEARAKYNEAIRNDDHSRYHGLTFWSPNINIFRDPRWGRGQETYGEDPYPDRTDGRGLHQGTAGHRSALFQSNRDAQSTMRYIAARSLRATCSTCSRARSDLKETYLPAFRAAIVEGKADSVMCAYNAWTACPACANTDLLQKTLHGEWGFQGYVVSDCGAIADIYRFHKYKATAAEASAVAVKAGTDLTCGNEYRALVDAVKSGLITEAGDQYVAGTPLRRALQARHVRPAGARAVCEDSVFRDRFAEHRKIALQAAREVDGAVEESNRRCR